MTATYNPAEIERLIAEAREDDAGMTPGPWEVRGGINGALFAIRPGADRHYETQSVTSTPDYGCNLGRIARTRNNLAAMADQLEAARQRIAVLDAAVERMAPVVAVAEQWRDQMYPGKRATDDGVRICDSPILRTVDAYRAKVRGGAEPAPAPGWRSGIEASIHRLEAQARKPRDLWHAAYFAAIDEALVHLRAMLERGAERSVTPLDDERTPTDPPTT